MCRNLANCLITLLARDPQHIVDTYICWYYSRFMLYTYVLTLFASSIALVATKIASNISYNGRGSECFSRLFRDLKNLKIGL